MMVYTLSRNHGITGLLVGSDNVRRYFPREITAVVLHLGHLHIQCELAPDFWHDCPEIYDARLSAWLESIHLHRRGDRASIPLAMIPAGVNAYCLQALSAIKVEEDKGMTRLDSRGGLDIGEHTCKQR